MSDNPQTIISILDEITSVEDEFELATLDDAVSSLLASKHPQLGIGALLRIFERFPEGDGHGVFWSVLHGLESLPDYESALVESVRRQPSEFGLLMINSILNDGRSQVGSVDLLVLLEEVARDPGIQGSIRADAQEYIEWQQSRA